MEKQEENRRTGEQNGEKKRREEKTTEDNRRERRKEEAAQGEDADEDRVWDGGIEGIDGGGERVYEFVGGDSSVSRTGGICEGACGNVPSDHLINQQQ